MNNSFFKAQQWAFSFIEGSNADRSGVELLLKEQMGWNDTELLMHLRDEMPQEELEKFQRNVEKYVNGYPAQYIIGKADFYGSKFKVNENTLIPRMETEELVDWILNENKVNDSLRVVDIGTGTGAIGLSLKKAVPEWKITLSDISTEALKVAAENAQTLDEEVYLTQSDLFENLNGKFDIIVSNPPYIAEDEKGLMDQSVLEHEPSLALFADNQGLKIYQRLAKECAPYLADDALMYLEIGFKQGKAVKEIFQKEFPDAKITIKKDISNHDRMVKIQF
ncbi:peptide chain release factor N(5)-glutamine methyltransferase [Ligilactobacillus cholophilus]|uniref:peptide chain release factor N(5)-glutamine methyltransferase n=1 Tax=Ligilactobacillus cholophilus TaxID=3050131 RepID=UPI0025B23D5E|nr:peptide chain release factor N(5)-glutamine methyltransferase [Ligilactobacillus cholophilus]